MNRHIPLRTSPHVSHGGQTLRLQTPECTAALGLDPDAGPWAYARAWRRAARAQGGDGREVRDADLSDLLWRGEQLGAIRTDMVVITTGRHAYRR